MFKVTAEYVKTELMKISFLLESNYQSILGKNKTLIKLINNLPVDWNMDFTSISGKKFKDFDELDDTFFEDEEFEDEAHIKTDKGVDTFKDMEIEGVLPDSKEKIKLRIRRSSHHADYYVYKEENGKWELKGQYRNMAGVAKLLNKSQGKDEGAELSEVYTNVLNDKRVKSEMISLLNNKMETKRPWKFRGVKSKLKLDLFVPGIDSDELPKLRDEIKRSNLEEELTSLLNEKVQAAGIDPSHIKFQYNTKLKEGFSIGVKHNPKEKHED